jgi:N-acetylglucosamine-6-phosphate deacetylase
VSAVALVDAVVCTGDAVLVEHAVVVEDGSIAAIVPVDSVPRGVQTVAVDGAYVAPGLVDLQVNGGGDVLLNDAPTAEGVAAIVAAHRRLGSTGVMPTLISAPRETIGAALEAVRAGVRDRVPGLLGLHVEGPFLAPERAGIHDARQIRPMTGEDAELLASLDAPTLVTLAPERVDHRLLERLVAGGVHVAAGHSAAEPADLDVAARAGLRLVTHLFNAMSGIGARRPGLAGAALADDRVACGLIADGHHVSPAAIEIALRCKPPGGLFLVSDAMPAVGGSEERFAIGGTPITVRDGRCVSADGVLAGSAASLADCVRHLVRLEVEVPDALRMASTIPADLVGLGDRVGRLAPGRVADLVVIGGDGGLRGVMLQGRFV